MKVLFVTPHLPAPPDFGGARRMFELIRHVAARHETVTLSLRGAGEDPDVTRRELGGTRLELVPVPATARMPPGTAKRRLQLRSLLSRSSFRRHFYYHPALQRRLDALLAVERFDVVQFEYSAMGIYHTGDAVSVLDVVDIEQDVLRQQAREGSVSRRLFNALEARKFAVEEHRAWRVASACTATSPSDAERVAAVTNRPVRVIPNGVDTAYFERQPLQGTRARDLLFVGALRYRPNAEAVTFFVEQVMPSLRRVLPEASLTVIGVDPPDEILALGDRDGVRVVGAVPDVRPYLAAAGTVVVPLHIGGGTRLKILEAFAAGRPVVSTALGAAGLAVAGGRELLLAERPEEWVAAVRRLDDDPLLRRRLADLGHALVRERYQWSAVAGQLMALYEQLVCQPSTQSGGGEPPPFVP